MTPDPHFSRRVFVERSLATAALIGSGGIVAACGGDEETAGTTQAGTDRGGKLTGKLAAHEFNLASIPNQQAFEALEAIGSLLGIETVQLSYDGNTDTQLAQINQMGTLGVTAVETLILDNGASRQIAEACVRNDIYLSTRAQIGPWLLPSEPEIDWHYQLLGLPGDGGFVLVSNMFEKVGGEGNFVHLSGVAGSATDVAFTAAVDRALADYPGMKLVSRQRADYDREKARVTLDAILTAINEDVAVVHCTNDDMALGAVATLQERGLTDVLVAGHDAIPEVVDNVIAGKIYGTAAIAAPWLAGYCMIQALDAANGHRPDPIEGLMKMDTLILDTPESAQVYKDVLAQGPAAIDYLKLSHVLHPDDWDPQWPIRTFDPTDFWEGEQGVAKPSGYELPENYTKRVDEGGYAEVDQAYFDHFKSFPFAEAARSSSTGKTAFETTMGLSYGF